jgi:hypothetical protein
VQVSTDWNIRCTLCGETHSFNDANHAVELMRGIIAIARGLAALGHAMAKSGFPYPYSLDVTTSYGSINPAWFAKHDGHPLVPISEYGEIDGTCGKRVACACGHERPCDRPVDHAPPCAFGDAK